jgi:2-keto-4-pentenoate hydratase
MSESPCAIEPRLVAAIAEQLDRRREALARGAAHVGWKLGMGDRERIGKHIAVGYLTSETVLEADGRFRPAAESEFHADAEIAVELASDVDPARGVRAVGEAVARYGAALEIVDLAPVTGEPDAVVAGNVFHRAVRFGELRPGPLAAVDVELSVDGQARASGRSPADVRGRIAEAARLLDAVGERLRAGDRIITGSVAQAPIGVGAEVVADFDVLGTIRVRISP